MITKERLEETIRGVIREFKRTSELPSPWLMNWRALEERVDDLFDQEAGFSYKEIQDSAA